MKTFGGTCPMCCGDVTTGGAAVCQFCGFHFERPGADSPVMAVPDTARVDLPGNIIAMPMVIEPPEAAWRMEQLRYGG